MELQEQEKSDNLFWLTQSALKDMEKQSTCPFRWKSQWLEGKIPFESNDFMDRGKYFEYLCLGASARANDEITDLPRLRTGEKTIVQQRIEKQVEVFMKMFTSGTEEYIGHTIIDSQIELRHNGRKGTIDFLTRDADGNLWMFDLKLTSDVNSTRTEYGWGNAWSTLDLVQLIHYHALYEAVRGESPRLALLVFDYSPSMGIKMGEVVVTNLAVEEKELRFKTAETVIELYKTNGWVTLPSESECSKCPLKCADRAAPFIVKRKLSL